VRASNEVILDRREFLAAATRVARGGLRKRAQICPRKTLLYADPPVLIVETPHVRTEFAATGKWEDPVAVNARLLITVVRKLPKTQSATLLYVNGRLYFDYFSIEAAPAPGMARAIDAKLGGVPGSEMNSSGPVDLAPAAGDQLLAPGFAPITDRERLEQRAKAPMRPRGR